VTAPLALAGLSLCLAAKLRCGASQYRLAISILKAHSALIHRHMREHYPALSPAQPKVSAMGQIGPPKTVFYEGDLAELEWVFQSVCSALGSPDEHETVAIRRRLFMLACNGMSDPEILSAHLIESFTRSRKRDAA
jgi:hypothetical protein